jgi:methylase of polypeptide subunit release factors
VLHVVNAEDAMRALHSAGVRVVRLDARGGAEASEADLLVPRAQKQVAAEALGRADWRFEVGSGGVWRLTRRASYGWDNGLVVHLHWGLPAAPLPSRALAPLERLLWERARPAESGASPIDPAVQLTVAAVQMARPGARRARWEKVAADAAGNVNGWADVADIAQVSRVAGSVGRALATLGTPTLASRADGVRDRLWLLSRRLYRRIGSRRVRALLSGTPLLGRSVRRCRFADIEVLVGPGVFRPMAVTEHMVDAALRAIPRGDATAVLEAGTGCGAVSLAIATERSDVEIHAADVSAAGLRWARRNQRTLGTRVRFCRGSLLGPFPLSLEQQAGVVAGNVPYIPAEREMAATGDTPGAVLGGGDDGLALVRRLSLDARRFLRPGGRLILQMLAAQWETFAGELEGMGYRPGGVEGRSGPHVVVTATVR